MNYIGCHLSATGGYEKMVKTALSIGADTFAFFTRNPRGSRARQEDPEDAARAAELMREHRFGPLVAHGPYTMNLCTKDPDARAFAKDILCDDLRRMANLPGNYYNFHPGAHVGQGEKTAVCFIAEALQEALAPGYPVTVLLETMAGKGTEVGRNFEELREIIDAAGSPDVGVCLDTCHIFDGGYNLRDNLDGVLQEFDRVIGLERLCALHVNDSKNGCGSHKDRHACIGEGYLGISTFDALMNHPALEGKPMILETPNELPGYKREIAMLRAMCRA